MVLLKKVIGRGVCFLFLTAFVALTIQVDLHAQISDTCTKDIGKPDLADGSSVKESAHGVCATESANFSVWSKRMISLGKIEDRIVRATERVDWVAAKAAFEEAKPIIVALRKAVYAYPDAVGSENARSMFSGDALTLIFQNVGLSAPPGGDVIAQVDALFSDSTQQLKAARLASSIAYQARIRGNDFIGGLDDAVKGEARKARVADLTAKATIRADQQKGGSVSGYIDGFGTRFSMFRGMVVEWTVIATILGGIFAFGAKRPRVVVKMPIIALAVLVPTWSVHVFFPFVPGWLQFVIAFFAGVALWHWSEKLPAPWSQVFSTTGAGRPSATAFAGSMLRAFAAGKGAADASQANAAADSRNTHGSARWGMPAEMQEKGHLLPVGQPGGFALGRVPDAPAGLDQRYRHVGHVVTVAPTGSGKGIGAVIPHLLEYPGSSLVLDVKGENAAVTARARRQLGNKVFIVDPFGVTAGETHAFNLLDRLDVSNPECVSESAVLADSLVIVDAKGGGEHFDESAKTLLQGLMLHVTGFVEPDRRNLGELRRLLTADEETFLGMMADMAADDIAAFGIPARAANTIMGMADKERGSVLSTARRNTAFLDDPRIAAALARSDFDLSNIKSELMTVYLVMPANKIGPNARFVRGFVGSVIAAITSSNKQPTHRVAFLLDEFGQLGYMKAIEDAVSLLRGYGLSFWVFIQDLSQLKGVYPKWQTFLANSAKTFYGTDDFDTAKYISDSLGQSTIEFETRNEGNNKGTGISGGGSSINRGKSDGTSQQYAARSLLTPDEVMRLGPERPIVLVKGEYPSVLTRLNYLTDAEYVGLADANPYHS